MSLGEAANRRSLRKALRAVVVCGLTGALFGVVGGSLGHAADRFFQSVVPVAPHNRTLFAQGIMLGMLGGGVGLAFGAFAGGTRPAVHGMLYGFLAGVLAGILYPFLTVAVLPPSSIHAIIPYEPKVVLLWVGLSSALYGLMIPSAVHKATAKKSLALADRSDTLPAGEKGTGTHAHDAAP